MASAVPSPEVDCSPSPRLTPLATISIGYLLLEVALWSPKSVQLWTSLVAATWIIGTTLFTGSTLAELGLTRNGFRRSAWIPLAASGAAAILIFIGWLFGWLHPLFGSMPPWPHAFAYTFWAFQQEFILQSFFFLGLLRMTTPRRAIIIAAILFSFAHLPNPVLVVATLFSGIALTSAFARYRNLYTITIAHAILGLAVAVSIPADVHRNMRVGLGYFTYHSAPAAQTASPRASSPSN